MLLTKYTSLFKLENNMQALTGILFPPYALWRSEPPSVMLGAGSFIKKLLELDMEVPSYNLRTLGV